MRFTVALPICHRSSLQARLGREVRGVLDWVEGPGPADVVLGLEEEGRLAGCPAWPGEEGALALIQAGFERWKDHRDMERLHQVGRALASEQHLDRLLDLILVQARRLLSAEAGSLYLVVGPERARELLFAHTQNARVNLPYHRYRMPITSESMAGHVAHTGEPLQIADVYALPEQVPYRFNDAFDRQANYCTRSMLSVPMKDTEGEVLGVLQLINRIDEETPRQVVPFEAIHLRLAQSLAGQAGVAVKNARLREEIETLFEGFVNASVTAIEQRDPVTSGHSGRVALLTVGLAEAVNATPNGPFGSIYFNERQLRELRYASLLHDFGKVGVREQVLVKSKKLDPMRLELILQCLRQRQDQRTLELLQRDWAAGRPFDSDRWSKLQEDLGRERDRFIALVVQSNEPSVLPSEAYAGLEELASLRFQHWKGQEEGILSTADLDCLRIPKGSLSEGERLEIESHVTHTFQFLRQIPWTRDLASVPDIAYAHHERMNGQGYPLRRMGSEIPLQSRCMAIADVFDALTAQDRPYKAALPLEKSLAILDSDARSGHLDSELLRLFVEARVFEPNFRSPVSFP